MPVFLLEWGLALAGYADESRFVFDSSINGRDIKVLNSRHLDHFFPGYHAPCKFRTDYFDPNRPDSVVTVVLAGSSLFYAEGSTDPAAILKKNLEEKYSRMGFELINLSIPLISSYTVKHLLEDAASLEPDLVVLAIGETEFYGALGSAGKISISGGHNIHDLYSELQHWRIYKLINNISTRIKAEKEFEGRLQDLARVDDISISSSLYLNTRRNFLRNLYGIEDMLSKKNIDLVLCAYPDPIRSTPPRSPLLRDSELNAEKLIDEFNKALASADTLGLHEQLSYMQIWEPRSALTAWMKGGLLNFEGLTDSAYNFYQKARDLDGLRCRGSHDFNESMKHFAQEKNRPFLDPDPLLYGLEERYFNGKNELRAEAYQLIMQEISQIIAIPQVKKAGYGKIITDNTD